MVNAVPYVTLAGIDMLVLLVVWLHTRQKAIFPQLLIFTGQIYLFEYIIMVILKSYEYRPHFISGPAFQDNVLGAVVSNMLSVPIIGVIAALYKLRFPWIAGLALVLAAIERFFSYIGVFKHFWWNEFFTFVSLIIFFLIAKLWVVQLKKGLRSIVYLSLLMFSFSLASTMMFTLALAGARLFHGGFFADPFRDDVAVATADAFVKALLITIIIIVTEKHLFRFGSIIVFAGLQALLVHKGVLHIFISLPLYYTIYTSCCAIVIAIASHFYRRLKLDALGWN
ncbi:hypothetical protein [Paenibacillus rigui]|uniref:Uncharacterized protein n=1 Tax=Paenibacillus rigui TaxID=554312 RepID=A0A229UWJ6_9BACL|nr:hypothetical protein [Paenibacillus rigui]OXM87822.1 hypothetical protein CF651_01535 [Paenibacillus rigui]